MGILDKIPGISGIKQYKEGVDALVYTNAVKIIESGYKKGRQNFLVLAMGIDSGMPIPEIVRKCEKFYKDNAGYSKKVKIGWPEEVCKRLDELFSNIDAEEYEKADAAWLRKEFILFLTQRCNIDKRKFLQILKRQKN